jgi:hypothetical protein
VRSFDTIVEITGAFASLSIFSIYPRLAMAFVELVIESSGNFFIEVISTDDQRIYRFSFLIGDGFGKFWFFKIGNETYSMGFGRVRSVLVFDRNFFFSNHSRKPIYKHFFLYDQRAYRSPSIFFSSPIRGLSYVVDRYKIFLLYDFNFCIVFVI